METGRTATVQAEAPVLTLDVCTSVSSVMDRNLSPITTLLSVDPADRF